MTRPKKDKQRVIDRAKVDGDKVAWRGDDGLWRAARNLRNVPWWAAEVDAFGEDAEARARFDEFVIEQRSREATK